MEAFILGIIQGLTEFLPISSSGHLLLFPTLVGWEPMGLTFDVALHFGTFLAVGLYFFSTWKTLLLGAVRGEGNQRMLLGYLVLATIPGALAGYFGEPYIESSLRQPELAAAMLILFGLFLWVADTVSAKKHELTQLTWPQALLIGLAQALALIPGVSRSGSTMTAGLLLGLSREATVRFSFLLLAPISLGATLTQVGNAMTYPDPGALVVGMATSFVVGLGAIHLMLTFINRYGFAPYVWYRIALGTLGLTVLLTRMV